MLPVSLAQMKDRRYAPYLVLLIRLLLAAVFLVSGANKLPLRLDFVEIVKDFELLPEFLAVAYGAALPWVELLAGGYLLLGILVKPSAVIVLLMALSFLIANSSAAVTGNSYCPSCFGELVALTIPQAIALDVFVLLAALALLFLSGKRDLLGFDAWFRRKFHYK